jgi:hypothetical protein
MSAKGGTRYANFPLGERATDTRSTREDDFDNVATDLMGDRLGQLTRRPRAERRLYPPHAATVSRQLEDHLGDARVVFEDLLDLLEERDGALVIQDLAKADDESKRLVLGR